MNASLKTCIALAVGLTIVPMMSACSDNDDDRKSLRAEREGFNEKLSLVSQWNELALFGVIESGARPTVASRQLFMVSTAMYDAWSAFDSVAVPYALDPSMKAAQASTEDDMARAVSQAAYQVLVKEFPDYERSTGNFSEYMKRLGYPILTVGSADTPDGIGFLAAEAVFASRAADGSNVEADYAEITSATYSEVYQARNSAIPGAGNGLFGPDYDLNRWQPLRVPTGTARDADGHPTVKDDDPSSYRDQTFLTPHWGAVTPFAMTTGAEFRPGPPPVFGDSSDYTDGKGDVMSNDEAFRRQFREVLDANANLTDLQRASAEFWADGARTESPPGHWNQLAHGISGRDQHTIADDAKLYFALNGALLDASIAAWDAKRAYDSPRPAAVIPHLYQGETITSYVVGKGFQQIDAADWRPYQSPTFVTPPFPEYVSGHSAFSHAAAEVLTEFTGAPTFYDGSTLSNEDVNGDSQPDLLGEFIVNTNTLLYDAGPASPLALQWNTFQDAAEEAARSRIYGGIHIQDGDLRAREVGRQTGQKAFKLAERYWSGDPALRP